MDSLHTVSLECNRKMKINFGGGDLSSDAGLLLIKEFLFKIGADKHFVANFIGKSNWIDESSMFRPEAMSFEEEKGCIRYDADIVSQQFIGNAYELILDKDGNRWVAMSPTRQPEKKVSVYMHKEPELFTAI